MPNEIVVAKPKGLLNRIFGGGDRQELTADIKKVAQIREADAYSFDGGTTVAALLGSGRRGSRTRQMIYEKWSFMEGDPIVSTALMLLVTGALGGHETTGDVVFIEKTAAALKDVAIAKIVDEIGKDIGPLFNQVAYTMAYNGAAFGDGYARPYLDSRGLSDLYVGELVRPVVIQPYEQGNRTVGHIAYTGKRMLTKLSVEQIVRLKMPRTVWVPQPSVVEKSYRMALEEDDPDNLPLLPAMAGGSFLYQAEEAYDNLYQSLLGLVGQRWIDSMDEAIVTANCESMTLDQQTRFLKSITRMFQSSKKRADDALKVGRPILEKIRHIIPVFGDKQVATISPANGGGSNRGRNIEIDDVLFHAKLLAGALGVDLSMLGFADQLAGGLGEGGFFRMSAQAAERARLLRGALSDFFYRCIDLHTLHRYKMVFPANARPFNINFYGSISALESERQRTRGDAMNSGMSLVAAMQQLKELKASTEMIVQVLSKQFLLDEDEAKLYAKSITEAILKDGGGE